MGTADIWYGVVTNRGTREEPRIRVADHPFFRGMDPGWIELASRGSTETIYDEGDLIVREGEFANRFHLVFHGEVAIEVGARFGERTRVQTIGPGEVLDWSGVYPPYIGRFDARALKETRVVSLDSMTLRRAMESHTDDGYRFLERLVTVVGQRLESLRNGALGGSER